jgi:hypothetical protein
MAHACDPVPMRPMLRLGGRDVPLPRAKAARLALGSGLVAGGLLAFLPVFGAWMIPAGVMVLSHDVAVVRRQRRRFDLRLARWARGVERPAPLVGLLVRLGLRTSKPVAGAPADC